jgi:hypothetical protein
MIELASWLASLPLSRALRQMNWLVPWLQIVHILANGMILSAVVMIDMRIWGLSRSQASLAMARRFGPWLWAGLVLLTMSGIMLILSAPRRPLTDLAFQVKMVTMVVAIAATVILQITLRPSGASWEGKPGGHRVVSMLATLTLVLWVGVTLAGRGRWFALMMTR